MTKRQCIGLVLSLAAFVVIYFYPGFKGLSPEGQRCLALFTTVFILYIFESIPAAVISLAIVPMLVILRITDIDYALSGFSSSSTYLVVGSFILAAAMIKTGLGKRITCRLLLLFGANPIRITLGLVAVNILMSFLIPSSTARTAMLLTICLSVIDEIKCDEKSKKIYAANLLMVLCVSSSTISAGILTSTISNPLAVEYIKNNSGQVVTYGQWFIWGFLPALVMTIISWAIIQLTFRIKGMSSGNTPEYLKRQLAEMGKISKREIITAAVIGFTVILWMIGDRVGIDSTSAALLGSLLLFIPMLSVMEWKECQTNISLGVVFIISGGISLGNAMASTGTSDWLADIVFGFIDKDTSLFVVVIAVIVIVQFMHIFFVGTATMANAFFPILVSVAGKMGVMPLYIIIPAAFMIGGYPVLTFFNTTPNILCYDTGYIKSYDFLKIGIPISIIACIIYSLCARWYWPFVGLL